jgi:Dolichyl-phosphate-mannose-protein mannosyltransferase
VRHKRLVPALVILAWFGAQTWRGLFAGLSSDDLMNAYQAWILPLGRLMLANVTPFTVTYRPLGSALYRVLFWTSGLDPFPYRVVAYSLMLVNIWLVFRLARVLTGSAETATLAALIWSFHKGLMSVYLENGTVYDVLCFTFFCLALIVYVEGRQWIAFSVLYCLALNSKEMAVTLPAVLLAYELLYRRTWKGLTAFWIAIGMTAVAIVAKTARASAFAGVGDYQVHLSVHQYFATTIPLLRELLFVPALNTFWAVLILVALFAVALALRDRNLLFAAILVVVLPLPINFIAYRGFFVMYLPMLGWALYGAILVVRVRTWLWSGVWKLPEAPVGDWGLDRVGLFVLTMVALYQVNSTGSVRSIYETPADQTLVRELTQAADRTHRDHPDAHRILFLRDGFAEDNWSPEFAARLTYGNPELVVDRVKKMSMRPDPGGYDVVVDH